LLTVLLLSIAIFVAFLSSGIHQIPEGYVGVYWRGGALMSSLSEPGWRIMVPLFTSYTEVQVTIQTDSVNNIPCGTGGGVMIIFDKIEVVNKLKKDYVIDTVRNYTVHYDKTWIFDKIHHEINQFCSAHTLQEVYITLFDTLDESLAKSLQRDCNIWAPGIEIISVRVTKPNIPQNIRQSYEKMESEKTALLIAAETQKVVEKNAETERRKATIEAEQQADVNKIHMNKLLIEKEIKQKMAKIEDEMFLAREKAYADAEFYKEEMKAKSNALLLTPEYLHYTNILSLANNTKFYFGEKIPSVLVDSDILKKS